MKQPQFLAATPTFGNLHRDSGGASASGSVACGARPGFHFDLSRIRIEPKLRISHPGDEHEREAERVAGGVVDGSATTKSRLFDSRGDEQQVPRRYCEESQHS